MLVRIGMPMRGRDTIPGSTRSLLEGIVLQRTEASLRSIENVCHLCKQIFLDKCNHGYCLAYMFLVIAGAIISKEGGCI